MKTANKIESVRPKTRSLFEYSASAKLEAYLIDRINRAWSLNRIHGDINLIITKAMKRSGVPADVFFIPRSTVQDWIIELGMPTRGKAGRPKTKKEKGVQHG